MPFYDITDRVVQLLGVAIQYAGTAALSGDASTQATGVKKRYASSSLSSESSIAPADSLRKASGSSDLSAVLTVSSGALVRVGGLATLDLSLNITATGRATLEAHMTGASNTEVTGGALRRAQSSSGLTSESLVTASATAALHCFSDLVVESALSPTAHRRLFSTSDLAGDGQLISSGTRVKFAQSDLLGSQVEMIGVGVIVHYAGSSLSATGNVPAVTALPIYRLILHTTKQAITDDYFLQRFPIDVGLSLLVNDGAVTEVQTPTQNDLSEADAYYLGGRHYQLSQAQRDVLVSAGYSSYIEEA